MWVFSRIECPFRSAGLFRRLGNILYATLRQKEINHITGEVHFLCLLLRKNKTLITVHDIRLMEELKGLKRWVYWIFWLYLPDKRIKLWVCPTEDVKRRLKMHLGQLTDNRIQVINNYVSQDFKWSPQRFRKLKTKLLQIGTFPNKNLKRVIAAITDLDVHLTIIGTLESEFVTLLEKHRIDYSNFRNISKEEIIKKYIETDILVFVSTYEGFGLPIIEANAIGRVVITSNVTSMPEVSGDAAHIVDPYSIDAIRFGIKRLIDDDEYRNQLIENGRINSLRFSEDKFVYEHRLVYEKISNVNNLGS